MCGVFGQIGVALDRTAVDAVRAVLRHRGPDSDGVHTTNSATLIHTRLKIIDLSPAAAQPMTNEDESVWVTFNGEIYNFQALRDQLAGLGHVFRSRSDTEVIVHGYGQWGDQIVERLDGMFAFGLWDARNRRVLVARDRSGKKPLFWTLRKGCLQFGSEIKSLFAAGTPIDIDPDGVAAFLAYGYVPPPSTLYRGIEQLPPASRLTWTPGQEPRIERYWNLDFAQRGKPTEEEAAHEVRDLLARAVRRRLVADVPVGAFLSGGLDSTIVVGLMASEGRRVRTFSIGFKGDARYDETAFARVAAKRFDTDHTEFVVEPRALDLLETLVWHHDGPFGDSSAVPTFLVSKLTREHVTVALNGDGGDELFAGYLRFWAASLAERVPQTFRRVAGALATVLPGSRSDRTLLARVRRFLRASDLDLGDRLTLWNSYFAFTLEEVLQPGVASSGIADRVLSFHRGFFKDNNRQSALAQALNHNFHTYLPYDLLVKMDRTSMAHALETRSPFLDTALMEYVAGLPDDFKLRGRTTKYILRRACADLLPSEIQRRGKMGFGMPLGTWFRGDLREFVRERLTTPSAKLNQYVRPDFVGRLLAEHTSGQADHCHQLWALLTLETWLQDPARLARPLA